MLAEHVQKTIRRQRERESSEARALCCFWHDIEIAQKCTRSMYERLACATTISMAQTTTIAVLRIKQQLQSATRAMCEYSTTYRNKFTRSETLLKQQRNEKRKKSLKLYSYSYGTHFFLWARWKQQKL